jgi:hypothetical protein
MSNPKTPDLAVAMAAVKAATAAIDAALTAIEAATANVEAATRAVAAANAAAQTKMTIVSPVRHARRGSIWPATRNISRSCPANHAHRHFSSPLPGRRFSLDENRGDN